LGKSTSMEGKVTLRGGTFTLDAYHGEAQDLAEGGIDVLSGKVFISWVNSHPYRVNPHPLRLHSHSMGVHSHWFRTIERRRTCLSVVLMFCAVKCFIPIG
jgi:hypothetical protein